MDKMKVGAIKESEENFTPDAIIFSGQEFKELIARPGMTLKPLTMREFVGYLNQTRGLLVERAKSYDFLESVYRLPKEEREELFKNLDGSVRTSFAAYVPVRKTVGMIPKMDRDKKLALLAKTLQRPERTVMAYMYSIDADHAFLGAPTRRRRKQ